jgi:hypothetical protein
MARTSGNDIIEERCHDRGLFVRGETQKLQELFMSEGVEAAFTAGALVGAVLAATVLLVPFVRYFVLVAATMAIVVIYLRGGVTELVDHVNALQAVVVSAPTFSAGIIGGGLAAVLLSLGRRTRRAAE